MKTRLLLSDGPNQPFNLRGCDASIVQIKQKSNEQEQKSIN